VKEKNKEKITQNENYSGIAYSIGIEKFSGVNR
jgi:hypothetical protein